MNLHECRVCGQTKPETAFFKATKAAYVDKICKPCKHEKQQERRRNFKAWAVTYKGGSCAICGYDKCQASLDFHHTDPSRKKFGFGAGGGLISKKKAAVELDKCILLCKNCHAEVHAGFHKAYFFGFMVPGDL